MHPSTFYTAPPDWTWLIIPYFYVGGIAGGSLFIAAMLRLFGRPTDRPIVWLGSDVAFLGALMSGILLIADLHRPERFWHMLVESETLRPMLKWWSPMSIGSWGVMLFSLFAFLTTLGALHESGRVRWRMLRPLSNGATAAVVAALGGISGFFLAGYTGVLLAVTNRPLWADSTWLGILFLLSGASTAAATLILLARWRGIGHPASLAYLSSLDTSALILELIALLLFLVSIGDAARHIFLGWWGVLLVLGVIVLGILLPLAISHGRLIRREHRLVSAASLVLIGGLLLRTVVILSSQGVHMADNRVILP
jgi:formate-dependent nitrite reductase membrane component NrfD